MTTSSSVETQALYEAVRAHLAPSLLPVFHAFREQLIQANAKDLGHDENASPSTSGATTPQIGLKSGTPAASTTAPAAQKPKASSSGLSTTKVEVEADLSIRKEDLWDLLTNQARIPMWTRAPAQVSDRSIDAR
jgi:activator of HSP90 ATPase